jgi:hypothetical protein
MMALTIVHTDHERLTLTTETGHLDKENTKMSAKMATPPVVI